MTFDPNDPRLTAFVLGELEPSERADIEAMLQDSPEGRQATDEIRLTVGWLTERLQEEQASHSQPARMTTLARGRALRLATRCASPRLTRPTTWAPVTGCGSTPAFTTDDWIVPSERSVDTTHRPWSPSTSRAKSSSPLTGEA